MEKHKPIQRYIITKKVSWLTWQLCVCGLKSTRKGYTRIYKAVFRMLDRMLNHHLNGLKKTVKFLGIHSLLPNTGSDAYNLPKGF